MKRNIIRLLSVITAILIALSVMSCYYDPLGLEEIKITLQSPLDGATVTNSTPALEWKSKPPAAEYHIMVDDDSDFSSPLINNESIKVTIYYVGTGSEELTNGSTYHWRVRGKNSAGKFGEWSNTWTFTVDIDESQTPIVVTLQNPQDDSTESTLTPTFEWQAIPAGSMYHLLIDDDSSFGSPVVDKDDIAGTLYTLSGTSGEVLGNGTTYYWRVRAQDGEGTWWDWSSEWEFSIISPIEFFDDFESYSIGYNPTDVYDYLCSPWTPVDLVLPDLFEVGLIDTNKVLQFYYDGPSYHFPSVHKFYKQEFIEIHEAGFTHYFTQPSVGWINLYFAYQSKSEGYSIQTDYSNRLGIYSFSEGNLGAMELWSDVVIINISHRLEVRREGDKLIASVTRLDTNETKTLEAVNSVYIGGKVAFKFQGDWSGGTYINVDDFYVKGIPLP